MDEVGETRRIGVEGQEKAPGLDGGAVGCHAGALELLVVVVPVLDHSSLSLHLPRRLRGFQSLDPPLTLLATLPIIRECWKTDLGEEEEEDPEDR